MNPSFKNSWIRPCTCTLCSHYGRFHLAERDRLCSIYSTSCVTSFLLLHGGGGRAHDRLNVCIIILFNGVSRQPKILKMREICHYLCAWVWPQTTHYLTFTNSVNYSVTHCSPNGSQLGVYVVEFMQNLRTSQEKHFYLGF